MPAELVEDDAALLCAWNLKFSTTWGLFVSSPHPSTGHTCTAAEKRTPRSMSAPLASYFTFLQSPASHGACTATACSAAAKRMALVRVESCTAVPTASVLLWSATCTWPRKLCATAITMRCVSADADALRLPSTRTTHSASDTSFTGRNSHTSRPDPWLVSRLSMPLSVRWSNIRHGRGLTKPGCSWKRCRSLEPSLNASLKSPRDSSVGYMQLRWLSCAHVSSVSSTCPPLAASDTCCVTWNASPRYTVVLVRSWTCFWKVPSLPKCMPMRTFGPRKMCSPVTLSTLALQLGSLSTALGQSTSTSVCCTSRQKSAAESQSAKASSKLSP
mmetsp:Transcript_10238/g.35626  ORF Transcript_10238/g.35626 Transcript_10238/m.35626 type:complete len:330 (+) Transcript_10238:250-1239(+)